LSFEELAVPAGRVCTSTPAIDTIIEPRSRDLGGFQVRRVLPSVRRRQVGPFVFLDHLGPTEFAAGIGLDVRPHPHIGLATVTYLWEGAILHRDSLGFAQRITPGAVNWMTAGRGIAHSERTPAAERALGHRVHGIQLWAALPLEQEEAPPGFQHHPADTLPHFEQGDASVRLLAGAAFGHVSPVRVSSQLFYADVWLPAGAEIALPLEYAERAAYLVEGALTCGAESLSEPKLLVFHAGIAVGLRATRDTRVLLLGGAALEGARLMWWNFVSSSSERLERAKLDWKEGRFPLVHGDVEDRIPLPDGP
jgi:redox-sensitive bicupin YhaK (pirin superfamily)